MTTGMEKENSESKLVVLCLKIDRVLHPAHIGKVGQIHTARLYLGANLYKWAFLDVFKSFKYSQFRGHFETLYPPTPPL